MTRTTCGVLVIDDEAHVLLGHATASPRWDIPKGIAEPGESWSEAAAREELWQSAAVPVSPLNVQPRSQLPYMRPETPPTVRPPQPSTLMALAEAASPAAPTGLLPPSRPVLHLMIVQCVRKFNIRNFETVFVLISYGFLGRTASTPRHMPPIDAYDCSPKSGVATFLILLPWKMCIF